MALEFHMAYRRPMQLALDTEDCAMERSDSRLLPVAVLNERRRRAVVLRLSGMTLDEVSSLCELNKNTVIGAMKAYRAGGWEAVAVQEHRGPNQGQGCLLNAQQQKAIQRLIHEHTPDELGLPWALWSRPAASALIARECEVRLAVRTVGSYLKHWGFSPQKPLNKSYEQNPAAVQRWLNEDYPAIVRRAAAEDGEIYWGDETGLRNDDVRGRSYAPQDETPVVKPRHRREKVGVISAVTNRGVVRWILLEKAINAALLIEFLKRLAGDAERKVFLILDNLRVHHAPSVAAWLEAHRDRIEVFYLPSYSPELNPDELLPPSVVHRLTGWTPTGETYPSNAETNCRQTPAASRIRAISAPSTRPPVRRGSWHRRSPCSERPTWGCPLGSRFPDPARPHAWRGPIWSFS
ncbi:IS630 family transposase [Noviherbaspirillum sedimenti]|uniref:IS630 family transposase n=1 Tax=Noviherbaspirillum sedimenti TaxID=2320865 RepID=A0A3A3G485_9BURK|nr:IS630 family transposase [Noviherbaspirillum sedimenti]